MPVCLQCGWEMILGPAGCACNQKARRDREMAENVKEGERLVALIQKEYPNWPSLVKERAVSEAMSKEQYDAKYTQGRRASFTVIVVRPDANGNAYETRFDADRLECVFGENMRPMLSFVSSGKRNEFPAEDIKAVEFAAPKAETNPTNGKRYWLGAHWCAGCDNALTHMVERPQ